MSATRYFHEGEAALQAESGVDTAAFESMVAGAMQPELKASEAAFVTDRTFSVATTLDAQSRPWSSPLLSATGQGLFVVRDQTTIVITPDPAPGDPLLSNAAATPALGVLYFDPARRRRMKSIGRAEVHGGALLYRMHRNFGICNKYIFKRDHTPAQPSQSSEPGQSAAAPTLGARHLDEQSAAQLSVADTVFLASHHDVNGADATHRGGPAGFVTVIDSSTISIPDYLGNGMFNTLGNLRVDPRVGFMTMDFATGRTVHLTGLGKVRLSPASDAMSARTLVIDIDEVLVTHQNHGVWTDIEEFPHRPGLVNPATPYLATPR
jgi:predicted pyridoxine 5'-phosphate oxidase superfamily flavin-nucleotide-binding protein